ncbi:MAG: hypothetical protein M1836_003153 [Candelina mexicana]|nr:MAG: hypothetical protein M1836_003153 [Candelina mexicana]
MPSPRPTSAIRSIRAINRSKPTPPLTRLTPPSAPQTRLSSSAHGDHHEDHYDPPSGWLWGVPPGETYKKEGWEGIWIYGFFGSLILGAVAYAYKPDTSGRGGSRIQTWALEEARRRLEAEGILKDPSPEKGK